MAVLDGGSLIGIWMLGCIEYISGPWSDVTNWDLVSPGEPAILSAVPMSGILGMSEDDEADFAAETAVKLVTTPNVSLASGQGTPVGFSHLHYGVFKEHDDPMSRRAQAHHAKVQGHRGLSVTEAAHPSIQNLTLVEIRKR